MTLKNLHCPHCSYKIPAPDLSGMASSIQLCPICGQWITVWKQTAGLVVQAGLAPNPEVPREDKLAAPMRIPWRA